MKLRHIALALGLACLPSGCADYNTVMRVSKNAHTHGGGYANWLENKPGTWVCGPSSLALVSCDKNRGTLYVDFQNRQASGQGVQSCGGMETEWKITGMRVVTAHADATATHDTTAPKLVVFDGDFRIKMPDGHVFRSHSGYDNTGPGPSGEDNRQYRQLGISLVADGVTLRDGMEYLGIVPVGNLFFH